MRIKEACRACGLTKKAIEYYEAQGLICPHVAENGYRQYDAKDVAVLKEIALLRKLGIGVADIKEILSGADRTASLARCLDRMQADMRRLDARCECLQYLVDNGGDVEKAAPHIDKILRDPDTLKEKLLRAFPGQYGLYLSIHFGPFLEGVVLDSPEKEAAYQAILEFLDNMEGMDFPPELAETMREVFDEMDRVDMEHTRNALLEAIRDPDAYMETNKGTIEVYLKYRKSDAYRNTVAGKMKEMLIAFQKSAGYYDAFIPNMKILSPSYCKYVEGLERANDAFMARYPEAKEDAFT